MGEQVRSAAAERTYNQRWLLGAVLVPLLLGLGTAAWMLTVGDRLPAELAIHWNAQNEVDGYSSLWGVMLMTVALAGGTGSVVSLLAIVTRSQSLLIARLGVGFGMGFGIALTALMAATVADQLDLADASHAGLAAPVMAGGLVLAFALGAAVIWLYRPGEIKRTQDPDVVAINKVATSSGSALAVAARQQAARGETMEVKIFLGPWTWVLSLGGGGALVAVSVYFIFAPLALLGVVVAALVRVFCEGTAVIGPPGVKVLASGFWKVMPLQWHEIKSASVEDIRVLDYGGWGYRMNGGSVGFIMGSGPALGMDVRFHQKFVISMPDLAMAAQAVALVNAYVTTQKVTP